MSVAIQTGNSVTVQGGNRVLISAPGPQGPAGTGGTPGGTNTQVQFNDSSAFGGDAGLTYNKTTDTLSATNLTVSGLSTLNHIHGSLAGNLYVHVKNTTAGTLAKGTPVYATGSVGASGEIEVAAADYTNAAKMPAIGILDAALGVNAEGNAVVVGEVTSLATNSYAINQELFVGTNGLLGALPATGQAQSIAVVSRVHASTGIIVVNAQARLNAALTALANNDGSSLTGITAAQVGALEPTGDGSSLTGITAAQVGAIADGDTLTTGLVFPITNGIRILDSSGDHRLSINGGDELTADRGLNFVVNDANRTLNLSGNLTVPSAATVSGTNTGDQTTVSGNAGTATAALGLKTATTTVSIDSATAPSSGQVLTATSSTAANWQTPAATGVTSVATSGAVNGLTLTGGPITSTGTVTLGGTLSGGSLTSAVSGILPVANGGTGINNAGTLTNASNTTITGGGTLALGGFTATIPATGTAALLGTANAFTAAQTITLNNLKQLTLNGDWLRSAATTTPAMLIAENGITSFSGSANGTGLGINSEAAFTGNLIDAQLAGVSKFSVAGDGNVVLYYAQATGGFKSGNCELGWTNNLIGIVGTIASSAFHLAGDAYLYRDAVGVWAMRNGTAKKELRVYDPYTSASDYHRLAMATTRLSQTTNNGTGSVTLTLAGSLIPAGAVVVGVTTKITTAITGVPSFDIGTTADPDRFGAALPITIGSTSDNRNWTVGTIECFPTATDLKLTATSGTFTGGVIYVSVQYMTGQAD